MQQGYRQLIPGILPLALLSGCGSGSYGSSSGPTATTAASPHTTGTGTAVGFGSASTLQGTNDAVVAASSVGGTVAVAAGASQTVSLIFTSTDGRLLSGFGISSMSGGLPAGWSGAQNFTCASVSVGSSCVANLTYSPAAADRGTLTIDYVFVDDATQPKTGGTLTIPYVGTTTNNVSATASPTGQITAITGAGTQSVSVTFTTDDGEAATDLMLTSDLTSLPMGWSTTAAGMTCAIVSTGSGCELVLRYAPATASSGTLNLSYTYLDDSGTSKTGVLNIPYSATSANNVVATASPAGEILAVQKTGGQTVPVTFTTDDGRTATGLFVTSDLKTLPAGWNSANESFNCASVGAGNGCQLLLTYAPATLGSGTLTVNYVYKDGTGAAREGSLNVAYAATTNDNVTGTAAPLGPINAVITDGSQPGNGSQAVTVTFATDDGRPATALQVTSDLALLPAGWTSTAPVPFACNGIDADNVCRLPLSYAPTAAGSGTLKLDYAYRNNAGEARNGSVSIAYRATTNNNVQWLSTPLPPAVRTGSSNTVNVTFQTDDGNPATLLSVTSALNALPAGWSSASPGFNCPTVSGATACVLSLTYAPSVAVAGGTLSLGYGYLNDAGYPSTGTVTIAYGAFTPYLYVVDGASNIISACGMKIDNTLAPCSLAAAGFTVPFGIALSNLYAYVTDAHSVWRCTLGSGGALTNCGTTGAAFTAPKYITVNAAATVAYVSDSAGITLCAIAASDGSLTGCAPTAAAFDPLYGIALTADNHAFSVGSSLIPGNPATSTGALEICNVATDGTGTLGMCSAAAVPAPLAAAALAIQDDILFVSSANSLYTCPINANSTLGSCQTTAAGVDVNGLAFFGSAAAGNSLAYVSTGSSTVLSCPVASGGVLAACGTLGDPSFAGTTGVAVRPR